MAVIERSLLFLAITETLILAQLIGIPPPGQITTLVSLTTSLPGAQDAAQTGVFASVAQDTLSSAIAAFAPLTTLATSISASTSQPLPDQFDGTASVAVSAEADASVQASVDAQTSYDSVTRYIRPPPVATGSATPTAYDTVTMYLVPGSGTSANGQSITNLESFPWIFPDSTTSAQISPVTDLESFPWILPDSSTTDTVSITNLETFPTFLPDSIVSTAVQPESPLSVLFSTLPVTVTPTQPLQTISSITLSIQSITGLVVFPSITSVSMIAPSQWPASSVAVVSSRPSIGTISPIAIALSTASGSARFSAPGQGLSVGTESASTISVAALTPVGLRPSAASSAVRPSGSATCRYDAPQCPACNGATVFDGNGQSYQVYCDAMVLTSKNYMRTGNSSASDCVAACNEFPGCGAASISRTNYCLLAVGSSYYLSAQKGEIGLLKLLRGSTLSAVSASATRTSSRVRSTTAKALASQRPNLAGCTLTDFNCPRCNLVNITDSYGQVFRILCDSYLISTESNDFNTTHLDDCLTSCNDGSCVGASYNNGLCHIARARLIGSVNTDGSFGFIPLRESIAVASSNMLGSDTISTYVGSTQVASPVSPQLLTPSAFPTGAFTIETWRTSTTAAFTASATTSCNTSLESICDTCTDLTDPNGQLYRVSCNWNWECSGATPLNTTSLKECMTACDEAPECQGGSFPDRDTRECFLCPEFKIYPEAQHGGLPIVMFYRPGSKGPGSVTGALAAPSLTSRPLVNSSAGLAISAMLPLSLTTITDRASWSSSSPSLITTTDGASLSARPVSITSQAIPSASIAAPAVSCPAANGQQYALGDIRQPFTIFCDVAVYAQPYSIYQVSSLLECAGDCDVGCSAFEYVNGICQLFDGLYDVIPAKGAIVGFAFASNAGVSGPEIFTVPGPVIASLPGVSSIAHTASADPLGY